MYQKGKKKVESDLAHLLNLPAMFGGQQFRCVPGNTKYMSDQNAYIFPPERNFLLFFLSLRRTETLMEEITWQGKIVDDKKKSNF